MGKKKKKIQNKNKPSWKRSIDLHGMRVEEALAALERFIDHCLMDDEVYKVEIVHGIGTGRVKAAVHDYLKKMTFVRAYAVDPINPGATWVEF